MFDEAARHERSLAVAVHPVAFARLGRFTLQVERGPRLIRGNEVERPAANGLDARRTAAQVRAVERSFELVQQPEAILNLVLGSRQQREVLHLELAVGGVAGHLKRMRVRPEIRRAEAERVDVIAAAVYHVDVARHCGVLVLENLRNHRTDHRSVVDEPGRLKRIAAGEEALVSAAVIGELVGDRADDRVLVGLLRELRQVLADVDARHVGLDRFEGTAELGRCVRLHVKGILVRRATG